MHSKQHVPIVTELSASDFAETENRLGILGSLILAVTAYIFLPLIATTWVAGADRLELQYAPSAVGNPLKGLVPYASSTNVHFPHSMEFNYVGFAELVKGYEQFEWQPLEKLLNQISGRGHQAVIRIYLEYPGKTNIIPRFLVDDGLKVHKYLNTNTQPLPPAQIETPDYGNPNLRKVLKRFLAEFGKRYDGDPRIGFITAGLLGTWGEWHTYPREELFASKEVQVEVMEAYEAAFKTTPILLRYPAGQDSWGKASNESRPFGYHDDSFAWATLDTGKKKDDWFFIPALHQAGPGAVQKWKRHPIGGEIRPEAWGKVFDEQPGIKEIQNFRQCVDQTHVSWLMDTGMFRERPDAMRKQRAETEVRHMGYDFHVKSITTSIESNSLIVELEIENGGVAPFYYDWGAEYGFISKGKIAKTAKGSGKLIGLLPGEPLRRWRDRLSLAELPPGEFTLAVRVPNTLSNGQPIRFANANQDADVDGWLTLTRIEHKQN